MIQFAKLTGRHYENAVEVIALHGIVLMARPVYSFPLVALPSQNWLSTYGANFMAVIDYEQDKVERPLFLGVIPLDNGAPLPDTVEGQRAFLVTHHFTMTLADDVNVWAVEQKYGAKQMLSITDDHAYFNTPDFRLGSENATERMLLGDTTVKLLSDLLQAIQQLTVPTSFGPSGFPLNTPAFITLENTLNTLLSQGNKLT